MSPNTHSPAPTYSAHSTQSPQGYPPQARTPQGYPQQGYPPQGYPQQQYQAPVAVDKTESICSIICTRVIAALILVFIIVCIKIFFGIE